MNKKAILMPEVLRMILAVLGIIILFGLAVALYGLFIKGDLDKINGHMNNLDRIVNNLEEGKTENYILLNPKNWILTSWPIDYTYYPPAVGPGAQPSPVSYLENVIPNECKKNSWKTCICLCSSSSYGGNIIEGCNKLAVCKQVVFDVEKNKPIWINSLIDNKQIVSFKLENNKVVMGIK
jgi:hypothetical protein